MEKTLTNQESLQLIREMVATSKNNLKDNSIFYLLWGWLVLAASLSQFAFIQLHLQYSWLPWPVLMTIGGVASGIIGYRLGKKSNVISHLDKMMIYLWYSFVVVLLIIIVMAIFHKISWMVVYPLIISLYGMGTFISGGILKFKPLIIGGVACWVISIVAFFVANEYVLLLTALSIVIAYLIPGYMLKAKS